MFCGARGEWRGVSGEMLRQLLMLQPTADRGPWTADRLLALHR
jgi:hypothetical protein